MKTTTPASTTTRSGWRLTITGADDSIDPGLLLQLSTLYKWLEWGILFSRSRIGTPRYPSMEWLNQLVQLQMTGWTSLLDPPPMQLSAHFCGATAREVMSGKSPEVPPLFQRMQINDFSVEKAENMETFPHQECIVQVKDMDDIARATAFFDARPRQKASMLFDVSGGNGIEASWWPKQVSPRVKIGFAGGITPANVTRVLDSIATSCPGDAPTWIDLESGARDSEGRFDMDRVLQLIEMVSVWLPPSVTS